VVDNSHDTDLENLTLQEWKLYHQVEITLQIMAFWQRILEGEKYVTGSLVPVAIYTICQSFMQVITSDGSDPVVKKLTRILLNDFDSCYHPTTKGKLKYSRGIADGHGNRYTEINRYFFWAAFLDPCTHHFLKKILTVENFKKGMLIINSALYHHLEKLVPRLVIPVGILRIPIFSAPVALFSQESRFLFHRNFFGTSSGNLSV
jgi:hypothetical protein